MAVQFECGDFLLFQVSYFSLFTATMNLTTQNELHIRWARFDHKSLEDVRMIHFRLFV